MQNKGKIAHNVHCTGALSSGQFVFDGYTATPDERVVRYPKCGSIVDYTDLSLKNKNYLNGKVSQFIDAYIRQHKVWTPEQILEELERRCQEDVDRGFFRRRIIRGIEDWNSEEADHWLLSKDGQGFALNRMEVSMKRISQ